MMLKAFPSSQQTISTDSAKVYLFAVEEFSLEAVKRACKQFVRGEVQNRNNAFAPSAPELVDVCRRAEGQLKVEEFEASHVFVEEGSELWRKIEMLRGTPIQSLNRRNGWNFSKEEVAQAEPLSLPKPPTEEEMAKRADALRKSIRYAAGDNDGDRDVA